MRDTIAGERFASLFPDVKVRRDSGRMDAWLLEQGYHTSFRAVGTGAGIAGHGAKLAILDDVPEVVISVRAWIDAQPKEAN